jgi:hypothetical protein
MRVLWAGGGIWSVEQMDQRERQRELNTCHHACKVGVVPPERMMNHTELPLR